MGFILEHQEPAFVLPVDIHIYIYAARIILFALFQVLKFSMLAQIAGSYGGEFHKAKALVFASEFLAHRVKRVKFGLYFVLYERLVQLY